MVSIWQKISRVLNSESNSEMPDRKFSSEWIESEREKSVRGEEIEPPWIVFGNVEPSAGSWRQGTAEHWLNNIWMPVWTNLSLEEKKEYLAKWNPPDDVWNEYITLRWWSDIQRNQEWLRGEKLKIADAEEIDPPWIAFPLSFARFGWDGGFLESWKLGVWIPFWDKLSEDEKGNYLEKWKPPNREWTENLESNWTGKIKKTEKWFEKQKAAAEVKRGFYGSEVTMPWEAFPPILSEKSGWDMNFVERWKNQVWNTYWKNVPKNELAAKVEELFPPKNWQNYLGLKWNEM